MTASPIDARGDIVDAASYVPIYRVLWFYAYAK